MGMLQELRKACKYACTFLGAWLGLVSRVLFGMPCDNLTWLSMHLGLVWYIITGSGILDVKLIQLFIIHITELLQFG